MKKEKRHAFGKDIYLLGANENGKKLWLEAPSWDCGWYWGFGYVETYTNNHNPEMARDINSHSHISGLVGCEIGGKWIHNLYDSPELKEKTFTEREGWELSELFKQFYLLQKVAEFAHKKPVAGCNVTTVKDVDHGDLSGWYEKTNKDMIPKITAKILGILSPSKKEEGAISTKRGL